MKRRSFLSGLGAVAALPVIPAPAMASAPAAISAAAYEYFDWAKMIVRAHNRCSPDMLQRLLKLDANLARQVQSALLKEGVISAPSVAGISHALDPLHPELRMMGTPVRMSPDHPDTALRKVSEKLETEMQDAEEQIPAPEPSAAETPRTRSEPEKPTE